MNLWYMLKKCMNLWNIMEFVWNKPDTKEQVLYEFHLPGVLGIDKVIGTESKRSYKG